MDNDKNLDLDKIVARRNREWEVIFDSVSELIILTDEKGIVTRCNRATMIKIGKPYQELVGRHIDNFFYTESPAVGEGSRIMPGEIKFPALDGWYYVSVYSFSLVAGNIKIIYVIREITNRIRTSKILQKQKQFFESLANNSPVAIVTLDSEQRITSINPTFENLFGYTQNEVLGSKLDSLITTEEVRAEAENYTQEALRGDTIHGFGQRRRKDGRLVDVEIFGVPVVVEGEEVGALGLYHDITELERARREAEQADRAKSEFLANMSHEIRTPMNGIIGMIDLTLDTKLSMEQRDFIETARDSAEALLHLINDILDFSKIESGQLDLEEIDFDLRTTVEGVAYTLAKRAEDKGLEISCLIYHEAPSYLRGDPGRIRQILVNLVGNAIKFTEKGEVVLRAKLEEETETHVKVHFSVSDTGIGIPEDRLPAVFDRFVQVDSSTTRKYGGSGLGLAIVKQLVEIMGGEIGVESATGQGSVFWFTAVFKKQPGKTIPLQPLDIDLQDKKILAVDDNATNRMIIKKMLEGFGCRAHVVPDGMSVLPALHAAKEGGDPFELVLLDMQLPEMDGVRILSLIKDDSIVKDTPVLILTSIGYRGDASRLRAVGCAGYLLKPIRQTQLYEAMVAVLKQRESNTEEESTFITRHTLSEQKHQSVRILLAEDNPVNQKVAVTLLTRAGYSVDSVETGIQAVEAVRNHQYSLVLMDVQMPELDGLEATKKIRTFEGDNLRTPIVAMTAHAMQGDRDRCLAAGMDDYLSKPIEPQEFFETIKKWALIPATQDLTDTEKVEEPGGNIPVDLATALPRFSNDKEFFREMFEEFVGYMNERIEPLWKMLEEGDLQTLSRTAHNLKGLAANFSATRLQELAADLEKQSLADETMKASSILSEITEEAKKITSFYESGWVK